MKDQVTMERPRIAARLQDVAHVRYGTRVVRKRDAGSGYHVYGGGGATFAMDEYNREDCYIVSRFGMSEECVRFVSGKFFLNDSGLTVESKDREILSQRFLDLFLLGHQVEIFSLGRGTAQKNLNVEAFKGLEIPLPPLGEQRRIVAILDEAFEGLARARAHAENNRRNARELLESFLKSAFEHSTAEWPKRFLPQISENLDRTRVPITKRDRVPGSVPYYGASGVVDHVEGFLFDEDLLLVSEDGANLLARTYPIAFSISGISWVNNHAHVLRFKDPVSQEFVRLYLNSISLAPYVSGMAQPKLNQAALNRIPIPYPDGAQRNEMVEKTAAISAETDRLSSLYRGSLSDLDELRQSILQRAFAGELTNAPELA